MDFNDRLRNQLHAQSNELQLSPEGSDAVRSRSRQRKQRRAGGIVMATVLVALLAGGWIAGRSGDVEANVATEGGSETSDGSTAAGQSDAAPSSTVAQEPIDVALPEAGLPLVLTAADNVGAPGGYNVYESGRSGDLYYVLSTAPGVTYDDIDEGIGTIRNDTVYTFDGSNWSQNSTGDRFVSTLDSDDSGLLYTVSTGTTAGQALELGRSANAGKDWSWTELDLSTVFGNDRSTWPPYTVQFVTRGSETFVVVHSNGQIDWEQAVELATSNGADIDPLANDVISIDQKGIRWIDRPQNSPCEAALNEALETRWTDQPEGPEIYADALQAVARVPGCSAFVKCSTEHTVLMREFDVEIERHYDENGESESDFPADGGAALDLLYANNADEIQAWAQSTGCDEELPYLATGGEEMSDAEPSSYASWENLGVIPPESWHAVSAGFIIDGEEVTNLGRIFDGESGYLVDVREVNGTWSATFDSTDYGVDAPPTSTFTVWASETGDEWTSEVTNTFTFGRPNSLMNGTTFTQDWTEEAAQLLRVAPDGTTSALNLADLAPDLDTAGYQIMNVRAGVYGAVAWAIQWEEAEEGVEPYDSIVLYSPDGIGWGATAVPNVEVVDVIVGDDEVVLFLNDPDRADGASQPIMIGRA